ncbi:hypothetical protein MY4824_001109 [Beauveria thailandica]
MPAQPSHFRQLLGQLDYDLHRPQSLVLIYDLALFLKPRCKITAQQADAQVLKWYGAAASSFPDDHERGFLLASQLQYLLLCGIWG